MSKKNLISFDDEVPHNPGKDVKDTGHMNTMAEDKYSVGLDSPTKRTRSRHKPFGKLGAKGKPS